MQTESYNQEVGLEGEGRSHAGGSQCSCEPTTGVMQKVCRAVLERQAVWLQRKVLSLMQVKALMLNNNLAKSLKLMVNDQRPCWLGGTFTYEKWKPYRFCKWWQKQVKRQYVWYLISTARLGGNGQGFLDLSLGTNIYILARLCLRHLSLDWVLTLCMIYHLQSQNSPSCSTVLSL